jgi:hypothetical protein
MIELKPGDAFRVKQAFNVSFKSEYLDAEIEFKVGQVFTVVDEQGGRIYTDVSVSTPLHSIKSTVALDAYFIEEDKIELLRPVEEEPEPEPEPEPPDPGVPPMATYRLSYVAVKKGRNRPATNMLQAVATKLGELKEKPDWKLAADGVFGNGTESVVKSIQSHYDLTADGVVGTKSWHAMTPDLESWRAPFQYRLAECQCTFEAGTHGYDYYGAIYWEGWFNYGIWNCNRESAQTLLSLGGASHLHAKVDAADAKYREYKNAWEAAQEMDEGPAKEQAEKVALQVKDEAYALAAEVGAWYGSSAGRDTQTGAYLLKYTVKPSIKNLVRAGFDIKSFGIDSLDALQSPEDIPVYLASFYERLLTLSCDITVNSGAGGFFPHKSPRAWDAKESGDIPWPADRLPFKEEAKQIFSEEFGKPIPDDWTYVTSDSSEPYAAALRRCLTELCQTDEQRIELIAELQARCIMEKWRNAIIERRRCVARKDGHAFQGTHYNIGEQFGIGV